MSRRDKAWAIAFTLFWLAVMVLYAMLMKGKL
jgi:hypothetical protein